MADGSTGRSGCWPESRHCVSTSTPRPVTLAVVDFADEEGARFSRSLLGSSGASGSLVPDSARHLVDKQGVSLPTRSPRTVSSWTV